MAILGDGRIIRFDVINVTPPNFLSQRTPAQTDPFHHGIQLQFPGRRSDFNYLLHNKYKAVMLSTIFGANDLEGILFKPMFYFHILDIITLFVNNANEDSNKYI